MTIDSVVDVVVPVVRNLREAANCCELFDHVVTVGPSVDEVRFDHPDHIVRTFGDVTHGWSAPRYEQIVDVLEWASVRDGRMLVHCHAGMSRSTATAWGVLIGRGWHAMDALAVLRERHPVEDDVWGFGGRRPFIPNGLIVEHVVRFFGLPSSLVREVGRVVDRW